MKKLWDYVGPFGEVLEEQLKEDDKKWGNTWRKRTLANQEQRIFNHIQNYRDQFEQVGTPVPWLKVAGLAIIAWVRENHPEELI